MFRTWKCRECGRTLTLLKVSGRVPDCGWCGVPMEREQG